LRPGTISPGSAVDTLAGRRRGALVPLLERKREILVGMAKERMLATLKHGDESPAKVNLPERAAETRDSIAAEIVTPARVDHRQLVDLGLVLTVVTVLTEVTVTGYRWRAEPMD
jgi:hypothetical protein